jgi:hypothetical protein
MGVKIVRGGHHATPIELVSALRILSITSKRQDNELSDDFTKPDWDKLHALFAEHMRWAKLSVTIEEIAKENKFLIRDLSKYDRTVAIPLLASLLTLPEPIALYSA